MVSAVFSAEGLSTALSITLFGGWVGPGDKCLYKGRALAILTVNPEIGSFMFVRDGLSQRSLGGRR